MKPVILKRLYLPRPYLAVCFALTLVGVVGCETEKARWTFARALNLSESGQIEEAIELMQVAMEQSPDDAEIKMSLAKLLAENGQGELGIGLCEVRLEDHPGDVSARRVRSTCLQYLGRFDESLAAYKHCLSGHVSRSPVEWNNLAYFRALAGKELDMAASDIQAAIKKVESQPWGSIYLVPLEVRTVIAAGLIARRIDQHQAVLTILSNEVGRYERRIAIQNSGVRALVTARSKQEFPLQKKAEDEILNVRAVRERQKNSLALMLATRALMLEDLGKTDRADSDRWEVEYLGFEFNKLTKQLPNDKACLFALQSGSLYLDTRGFVSGRLDWLGEPGPSDESGPVKTQTSRSSYAVALRDLDFAVLAAQIRQSALESSIYNTPELSAREIRYLKKEANRMTAVLLYHRMEVHLRARKQDAADAEQLRIEKLGFQPGASLF